MKLNARRLLNGNYKFFAMTTLAVTALNFFVTMFLGSLFSSGGLWNLILQIGCTAIIDIFYYLILAGVIRTYMKLSTGEYYGAEDLLFAFSNRPEQIAIFAVIQFVLETVMANIVLDYPLDILLGTAPLFDPVRILTAAAVLLIFTWIQLRVTLVLYLYNEDPERSMIELMKESWSLMNGKCFRLFWLELSFIGVEILSLLSFGIGKLFVEPYQRTTITLFVDEVCGGFHRDAVETDADRNADLSSDSYTDSYTD